MSEMGRLNFAQKGPACVWKLDFKPALACIRLSNIEFSSRGAAEFFSSLTQLRIEERARCVTAIQDFDTNDINQWKVKLIIAIVCILFTTIYNVTICKNVRLRPTVYIML